MKDNPKMHKAQKRMNVFFDKVGEEQGTTKKATSDEKLKRQQVATAHNYHYNRMGN